MRSALPASRSYSIGLVPKSRLHSFDASVLFAPLCMIWNSPRLPPVATVNHPMIESIEIYERPKLKSSLQIADLDRSPS